MYLDLAKREINLKIVYYGPALSGKTTNIEQIHAHVASTHRSDLMEIKNDEDRTLFFDFLQLELGDIRGFKPKVHLYTVPGQVYYEASRKLVLQDMDGAVFVVDSTPERMDDNRRLWRDMLGYFSELKIPTKTPIVVQFNKQDRPEALPPDNLTDALDIRDRIRVPAAALNGEGVLQTLRAILHLVLLDHQTQTA